LGKVKTEQIKRLGKELIERFPEKFSKSFEENKHAVVELTKGTTTRIRNQIAGYITSQCAPEEEMEAGEGEELPEEEATA
jgi:small subunit ribosomal protein S17e